MLSLIELVQCVVKTRNSRGIALCVLKRIRCLCVEGISFVCGAEYLSCERERFEFVGGRDNLAVWRGFGCD